MTFDYGRSRQAADRLIARFGQAATLRRPTTTGTAYNPTPGEPDDHPVKAVVTEYAQRDIDGTRIKAADRKVLMSVGSLAIEPATSDKLVMGGVSYSIIDIRPLNPGGTVVMYEMQARR